MALRSFSMSAPFPPAPVCAAAQTGAPIRLLGVFFRRRLVGAGRRRARAITNSATKMPIPPSASSVDVAVMPVAAFAALAAAIIPSVEGSGASGTANPDSMKYSASRIPPTR